MEFYYRELEMKKSEKVKIKEDNIENKGSIENDNKDVKIFLTSSSNQNRSNLLTEEERIISPCYRENFIIVRK